MEQLAVEEGLPECMIDGPTEGLVVMGYIQEEVEELEQAIVAFPRVPQNFIHQAGKTKYWVNTSTSYKSHLK